MTTLRVISLSNTADHKSNGHAQSVLVQRPAYKFACLPEELRQRGRFVLYRNQQGRKVPYCAANPAKPASINDPSTWATFELTLAAYNTNPSVDGINAVCTPDFTFVDLDDCVDEEGEPSNEALMIMQSLPETYWEFSPSKTGLHGVFHSEGRIYIEKHPGSLVEAYSERHFMSVTGWVDNKVQPLGTLSPKDLEPYDKRPRAVSAKAKATKATTTISAGQRTNTLLSIAGTMRRRGLSMEAIGLAIRQHNAEHCQPPLDEKRIQSILKSFDKYEAAGSLLVQENKDVGNADRLLLLGEGNYRFVPAFNRWGVYDGRRWPVEDREQEEIRKHAHAAMRAFGVQAAQTGNEGSIKFAAECLNSSRITNMLREAQPHATLHIAELDRDALLVNFLNGTYDARTKKLREHRREDYITAVIPHDFDPKAKCPLWNKFLEETCEGNKEQIAFLQAAFGYSMTAVTREKCIFLAHGPTDTGKTTLLATVNQLLGDYAGRIKVESLMVERGKSLDNNAQADLADLRGKRLVVTSETGQGQLIREQTIKFLSQGQGKYRAVRKYENPFDFLETWKIWMDCNHLPGVRDTDESIWQRLIVIPFRHRVPKAKQNTKLGQLFISQEAEGILAWMIAGLEVWMNKGLSLPKNIQAQREEWRKESDSLGQWLEECCVLRNDANTSSLQLYESYMQWRNSHGLYPESMVVFARNMKERSFEKKLVGDKKVPHWRGVGLVGR